MRTVIFLFILTFIIPSALLGQGRPTPARLPAIVPVKENIVVDTGTVSGRVYSNKTLGFEIAFPDGWLISGDGFEQEMKKHGFDLSLKAPDSLTPPAKSQLNRAIKTVDILLTAYRSTPGSKDNAIVRVSVEDLSANPQIKDAVDYFDAMRAMYASLKLPTDFKYSETQAEKLGNMQFGFLDVDSSAGKKRMYATVRKGFAIQFTLSYTNAADLRAFRGILENGKF